MARPVETLTLDHMRGPSQVLALNTSRPAIHVRLYESGEAQGVDHCPFDRIGRTEILREPSEK